jgi:regulatory protein
MFNQKSYTVTEAKSRMERYCAYQERCHKEVRQKLREMRMIPASVDQIIGHLIEHNFLNETRFAQAFSRGKFRTKKWGKQRIIRELKMRDISKYNITLALKEFSEEEYLSTFHELAEKRWQQLNSEENLQRKKKKFLDYMSYRGWESTLIWDELKELTAQ